MHQDNTTLIYFSPTGTTRTILGQIAKGLGKNEFTTIDITNAEVRSRPAPKFGDGLVLMGAPVYAGRLPKEASDYFKTIQASGSAAILIVLYGNREFEDALLELKNIAVDSGFIPLAAAAFIGEHSFSSKDTPIAQNRPDAGDQHKAFLFGQDIANFLPRIKTASALSFVDVPGNLPYRDGLAMGPFSFIDVTDACDGCGICIPACPKDAIDETARYAPIEKECIFCCACIKACPPQARIMKESPLREKAVFLSETCSQRKEPRLFMPWKQ